MNDQGERPELLISVIGAFRVLAHNGEDLTPRGRKARALLALLALSPTHRRSRLGLQDRLWSDRGPHQGAASLRQTLFEIRRAFGDNHRDCLVSDIHGIGFVKGRVAVDIDTTDLSELGRAVELPQLLDDIDVADKEFEHWVRDQRAAFEERITAAAVAADPPVPEPDVSPNRSAPSAPALALPDKPSIAVLPFQNMSGDPEQEYFADGLVEEITTVIARFPWLSVIARNSSFTYKGKAVDVKQVGHELGVRYVLEGSVRRASNRVRITAQLIDTATGAHLWADRFDGSLDDIFELQDQVASRVVGVIEPRLRVTETDRASRKPTDNLDAYDLYLRALAQNSKRTEEGAAESIRLARRALELDPAFAPAMGRIVVSRHMQLMRHWIPASGAEVEEGINMARQALAVARDNPEVLRVAGFALAALAGENEAALTALDRAIELNPNYALAYAHRGHVLSWLNRPDEAIAAAERGMRLSLNDPTVYQPYLGLSYAYLAAGRYGEALPWADRASGRNAGLPALRVKLSLCGHLGRREEASKCLQRLRETYPEPTVAAVMRDLGKGVSPEFAARIAEGLRKAGLPEG